MVKTTFVWCAVVLSMGCLCRAQEAPTPNAAETPEVKPAATDTVSPESSNTRKPWFKRAVSVEAATATIPGAVVQQFHDWPEEWGKRRDGFEKRVGSLYGQFVIGVAIEDTVRALHHEDTTYRRLGRGNFFRRTAHVVTGTVVARKPDGSRTMALSVPANAYGSWAIATLWSPREFRNAESIFEWGSAGVGTMAGTNLLREFWPDLKAIFKKSK